VDISVKKTKDLKQGYRPGRPKILSPKKRRHLGQLARSRAGATSFEITNTLNNIYPELNIATRTVRENLWKLGYRVCIPKKTPFLTPIAKERQVAWANVHKRKKWGNVIFSDKTLVEMAAYYPQSVTSLLSISGVGQVKLRQYGQAFLDVIVPYCEKHGLKANPKEAPREKSDTNRRYVIVSEAYNSGETLQSLTERYHVTTSTILDHLARYLAAGNKLRNGEDLQALTAVTPDQQQAAFAAFGELSPTFLKPVFDKLGGALSYDDLNILRMLYMISHQTNN